MRIMHRSIKFYIATEFQTNGVHYTRGHTRIFMVALQSTQNTKPRKYKTNVKTQ